MTHPRTFCTELFGTRCLLQTLRTFLAFSRNVSILMRFICCANNSVFLRWAGTRYRFISETSDGGRNTVSFQQVGNCFLPSSVMYYSVRSPRVFQCQGLCTDRGPLRTTPGVILKCSCQQMSCDFHLMDLLQLELQYTLFAGTNYRLGFNSKKGMTDYSHCYIRLN